MSENNRVARYRLRVLKIEEFFVEVVAGSIDEARECVSEQRGVHLRLAPPVLNGTSHGIMSVTTAHKPIRYQVLGKHEYVK